MDCQHLTIVTETCNNCGCAYRFCPACEAVEEYEEPQDNCNISLCGCHTDTAKEL